MYLKRLELSGFKSFAKKTSFELDAPITAIVGPNGSGKSNVAEGVRFVLGEQSMKSLRGKSGTDLIFKGGKTAGALGRASVSIVFDNKKRVFQKKDGSAGGINVDFDEIIITREVYGDGENHYLVNGSQVRLKDILELLAPLNIGSSGHHIISQGEADKILNASIRERKEMVEDALGLRVYQYKIAESERKLEKTNANMKEAGALRRELAPHIIFLKKQVEKIEKAKEMREELRILYLAYFAREVAYLSNEEKKIAKDANIRHELVALEQKLIGLKRELTLTPENEASNERRRAMDEELAAVRNKKDELSRRLGRLEGMIELEEERAGERARSTEALGLAMVPLHDVEALSLEVSETAERALGKEASALEAALRAIREKLVSFVKRVRAEKAAPSAHIAEKLKELKRERAEGERELADVVAKERELAGAVAKIQGELEAAKESLRDKERAYFELSSKRSELVSAAGILSIQEEKLRNERSYFERELAEAAVLVGEAVKQYGHAEGEEERVEQEKRLKSIERLKIRLEDAGLSSIDETMREYEEITARDQFLEKELADLSSSKTSLEGLIAELKEKLSEEFKHGVGKINSQFGEFFKMMFGGGTSSLAVVKREKRQYRSVDDEAEEGVLLDDGEKEFEEGIEINVSLPQKKVRDLNMLSGGERALTSIALLFAISQVNPPPFLILDETDAALDEANSRKYGDMLENLSKFSHLVVITHNRETMSRASVLYGVTMAGEGISKLLSVKFDEAAAYAK